RRAERARRVGRPIPSLASLGTDDLGVAKTLEHAELVVFRVGHHNPGHFALPDVDATGSQRDQTLDFFLLRHADRVHVDVQPVLHGFGFGDGAEDDHRWYGAGAYLVPDQRARPDLDDP